MRGESTLPVEMTQNVYTSVKKLLKNFIDLGRDRSWKGIFGNLTMLLLTAQE